MAFSAGTVFLDVVPSFHNLQRRVERETRGIGPALERNLERGAKGAAQKAGKAGEEAGKNYSGAFARRFAADLDKVAKAIKITADVDSSDASRDLARLGREIEAFSGREIRVDVDGDEAVAEARRIERELNRIARDQNVDIDLRFNASDARAAVQRFREDLIRSMPGGSDRDRAEATRMNRDLDAQRRLMLRDAYRENAEYNARKLADERKMLEAAYRENADFNARRATLERDAYRENAERTARRRRDEANMLREAYRMNADFDARRAEARRKADADYLDDMRSLARETARTQADLRRAVAQQTEDTDRSSRTGDDGDLQRTLASIEARYEAEERAANAAANERIRAAARGLAGEAAAAEMAQQSVEEAYKEQARAAAAAAAARIAAARAAAAAERAAAQGQRDSLGSVLAANTGQAANSFRVFNGMLLTAIAIGPLLIPVLAGIAAGLGAISVMAVGAIAGIIGLVAGFGGVGTAVQALSGVAKERRKQGRAANSGEGARDLRGLRDAQQALGRAREDAGRQIAAAARQQEAAERSLTRAVEDAADAQRDLVAARREAARDLEDQNARLAAGLLEEQLAAFALQEAGYRYNNILEDDQASGREKEIASLEYKQAQQQYADLQRQNARMREDVAAANAKGVEGSDQVVAAQERVVETTEAIGEAQQAVSEASGDVARARVEEARTLADAERRVADAMVDLQQKSVAAGVDGSAAMDQLHESMRNLSPAGQAFAAFLYGLGPFLREIRFAAQEGLLPGVQAGLEAIIGTYGPGFITFVGEISKLLGDLAEKAGNALTQPFWQDFFGMMARYAPIFLSQFASISGGILEMIAGVLMAFAPFSVEIGDAFVQIARAMADWGKNLAGSEAFAEFLDYVRESGPKVFGLITGILLIILKLMVGLEPYAGLLLDIVGGFVDWLAAMDPQQLAVIFGVLFAIVGVIQVLAGVIAVVSSVAGLIMGVLGAVTAIAAAGGFAAIAAAAAPILAIVAAVALAIGAIVGLAVWLKHLWDTNEEFRARVTGIWEGVQRVVGAVVDFLVGRFEFFGGIILFVWTTFIQPVVNFIMGIFNIMGQVIGAVVNMIVQIFTYILLPAWQLVWSRIQEGWNTYIRPVFDLLGSFIERNVAPAFQLGVDLIGRIWNGLIELAKAPVRFVVDTVINRGIIDTFNRLTDVFPGMTKVDHVQLPKGFATGGILPGYTPGRDVHRFVSPTGGVLDLSGGEAILRPEITRVLGTSWINEANAAARSGGTKGVSRFLGGYADGGILGWLGQAGEKATDAISAVVGGAVDLMRDPSGTMKRVLETLLGSDNKGWAGLVASVPRKILDGVLAAIQGAFGGDERATPSGMGGMGYQAMQSLLLGTFPGARITSSFRPGAITAVGTKSYHGMGRALDIAPDMSIFRWLSTNFPDSRELFYSPAGPAQILNGSRNPRLAPVTVRDHFDHIHWAMKSGGIVPKLYDNGGQLPPGLSVIQNKTGKPEAVLTGAQMSALMDKSGLNGNGAGRSAPLVGVYGDVNGGEAMLDRLADRIDTKLRDAANLHQLDSMEVYG